MCWDEVHDAWSVMAIVDRYEVREFGSEAVISRVVERKGNGCVVVPY